MAGVSWSLAGMRRRAAMWLIAAWTLFSVTQAFAACCTTPGNTAGVPADMPTAMHAHHADAHDDCCPPSEAGCPMVLDEAPVPSAASLGFLLSDQSQHLLPTMLSVAARAAPVLRADRGSREPVSQAPPGRLYLRLQRILI